MCLAGIGEVVAGILGDNALEAYFSPEARAAVASALGKSGLSREELSDFVNDSIARGESIGVIIAGVARLESAGPAMASRLRHPNLPIETSVLIAALGDIRYKPAYEDIVPYVGTPQRHGALIALAQLEFDRTASYVAEQVRCAVGEMEASPPVAAGGQTYEHPLMVTLDVIIGDSIEAVGVEQTAERLSGIGLKTREERAFMERAIQNATYKSKGASRLLDLYRKNPCSSSNV
jgi:hypothetical protein